MFCILILVLYSIELYAWVIESLIDRLTTSRVKLLFKLISEGRHMIHHAPDGIVSGDRVGAAKTLDEAGLLRKTDLSRFMRAPENGRESGVQSIQSDLRVEFMHML